MIKVAVFDLGGVVWNHFIFHDELFPAWANLIGWESDRLRKEFNRVYQEIEKGQLKLSDWLQSLNPAIDTNQCQLVLDQLLKKYFKTSTNWEMVGLISSLKRNGLAIGCLSNAEGFMAPLHRWLQAEIGFDFQILSYQVRARKPDEEIYQEIFNFGSWRSEEVVFIDDTPKNVIGAQKLGINAIKFDNNRQLQDDLLTWGIKIS